LDRHSVVADAVEALRKHPSREVVRRLATAFGLEAPDRAMEEAEEFLSQIQRKAGEVDARLETMETKRYQLSDEQKDRLARMREEHERSAVVVGETAPSPAERLEPHRGQGADGRERPRLNEGQAVATAQPPQRPGLR
jgi:DNA anti-recombination protein RmuC